MHQSQVREDGVVHVLEEERDRVEGVEGYAVRQLDKIQLLLFGEYVFDVGFELWVRFEDFGADGTLRRGFYFRFCA